jgi:hypothetical protein
VQLSSHSTVTAWEEKKLSKFISPLFILRSFRKPVRMCLPVWPQNSCDSKRQLIWLSGNRLDIKEEGEKKQQNNIKKIIRQLNSRSPPLSLSFKVLSVQVIVC